jgi:hypothetical protein
MTKRMARMSCKSFLEMPCTAKHVLQPGEETRLGYSKSKRRQQGVEHKLVVGVQLLI